MKKTRGGRKSLGPRVLIGTRVRPEVVQMLDQVAVHEGFETRSEYLAFLIERELTEPPANYFVQESLPMTG